MADTLHISGAPPTRTSTNYAALRESGMGWIRSWAAETWTDHNVHDPGITLLEAFSYAMTELGLRLELDMADLLKSGEAVAAPQLVAAHLALPMGPVHAEDLRRVLLDHPLVSDAQIFELAEGEVAFYAQPGVDPPFTYVPGTDRIRPSGLYEALVELADRELNTNTYASQVSVGAQVFDIELALPFWDDPEAAPFLQSATVDTIAMIDTGGAWRALPEAQSYFGKLAVGYTDSGGVPGSIEIWVLLRIATPLQPAGVTPAVLLAARAAVEAVAAGAPLARFATRVLAAATAVESLRTFLAGWRNLCEQAVRIGLARVQEVAVRATLEVTGGIDLEMLIARIFVDIDALLSPRIHFETLATRRAADPDPEDIYDGPLLRRGFLTSESTDVAVPSVVYNSDILRLIMRRRSDVGTDLVSQENPVGRDIVAVSDLTLANYINNRVITANAQDCLHLVEIQRYRPRLSLSKSRITTVRNDAEVVYDLVRVQARFTQLQADADAAAFTGNASPVWAVTSGEALPVADYTPLQQELPALYGVGEAALPDSADPERRAAAKQFAGYLLPLEQLLGDVTTQLSHINRFYSGAADEPASYFVRPPFDLPGAPGLLRRFTPGSDWQAFIADPDNPVLGALHDAAESRDDWLDRRNRMLDHLLARHGEDAVALAQETHRWARAELAAQNLPPAQQDASIAARRQAANARLLQLKSALLRDVPELNAFRLLANSNPVASDASLVSVAPSGAGFAWFLAPAGAQLLRAVDALDSVAAAGIAAERAFNLAGRASNYQVVDVGGGQQRLRILAGGGALARALAESTQSFGSIAAAGAALPDIAAAFATRRIESSLSPMERRIAHQTGIRAAARRRSLTDASVFFEIVDDLTAPPGQVGKRWRLHAPPPGTGPVMLVSAVRFDAPTDPQAVALAEASIRLVQRYGQDEWNYGIVPAGATFAIELRDPGGNLVATSDTALATSALAEAAIASVVEHVFMNYAGETLYLVEHLLLRPRRNGDPFLSVPVDATTRERDPYSQRLSLVFPSGQVRDFATTATTPATPDRFRDPAFRQHVAGMVQRACPAHLLPTLYWVDRQTPGPAVAASFDTFEDRYFTWLDSVLIPGASPAAAESARNDLLEALDAIAHDAA